MKLGELCEKNIDTIKDSYDGFIDYIDISSVNNKSKKIVQTQTIMAQEAPSRAKQIVKVGDILVSTVRPNLNAVAIVEKSSDNLLVASTGYCVLRCLPNTYNRYIFYFCQSPLFIRAMTSQATGASYPAVTSTIIKNCFLNIPTIDEQRSIAAILDKVSDLIAQRRAQLDKLDLLVKSRFVEMFGDPHLNPKGWPITTIGNVIETIESGWSGNGTQRAKGPNEIAVLKVSAVTKGYFIPDECKVLDDQQNIKKYIFPQKGDLLFSRANTRELVGATAIVFEDHPDLILPDKLWKIHFTEEADVFYMKYILSSNVVRTEFSSVSTGTSGSMYNVSMEKFKNVKIPVPPIYLQKEFAFFAEKVNGFHSIITKSLQKMEVMQKALMLNYFG